MAKPPKFTVVRAPDRSETQHVLDPENYAGWEVLGTHVGELGPDEEWDDAAKKPAVNKAARAKRERENKQNDKAATMAMIEALQERVTALEAIVKGNTP